MTAKSTNVSLGNQGERKQRMPSPSRNYNFNFSTANGTSTVEAHPERHVVHPQLLSVHTLSTADTRVIRERGETRAI